MGTRVLIASDHPLTRTGLRQTLQSAPGFEVVAEADAPGPVRELCRRFSANVVVFEITVPGVSGLRTAAAVAKAALPARTVAVASNENVYYVRSLLAAGVAGYVLRKATHEELFLAMHHARCGLRYIDPRLSDGMGEVLLRSTTKQAARPGGLSPREAEVLRAVARGFTSSEIGQQLKVSAKTVETYRGRICEKLGLRTRADLFQYAMAAGMLEEGGS
ncbi:MAG TPA: response regulator transcription factor [Terriglobales bacterium]|jgi:DNA-binding NarL/FixJ family response regulator